MFVAGLWPMGVFIAFWALTHRTLDYVNNYHGFHTCFIFSVNIFWVKMFLGNKIFTIVIILLQVVKRGAAQQEAAPAMTWPRIARGSPFATARFARSPFPRGMSGGYRPRGLIKPGARSLQWKRDTQATPAESGTPVVGSAIPSPTARSLTYVRTEAKPEGN